MCGEPFVVLLDAVNTIGEKVIGDALYAWPGLGPGLLLAYGGSKTSKVTTEYTEETRKESRLRYRAHLQVKKFRLNADKKRPSLTVKIARDNLLCFEISLIFRGFR